VDLTSDIKSRRWVFEFPPKLAKPLAAIRGEETAPEPFHCPEHFLGIRNFRFARLELPKIRASDLKIGRQGTGRQRKHRWIPAAGADNLGEDHRPKINTQRAQNPAYSLLNARLIAHRDRLLPID
jgi:hypothetical protein